MLKVTKRILATVMVLTLILTMTDYSGVVELVKEVSAATNIELYPLNTIVNEEIIPDTELRKALKEIIGEGQDITFGQLKAYSEALDLSAYTEIQDLTGLGYMVKATSMDLSKLTKVKKISKYEFQMCEFTSVKLPENLEEIGEAAFYYCSNLATVEMPETLTKIFNSAFNGCKNLKNISLPDSLIKIGNEAFSGCESIERVVIPSKINEALENTSDDSVNGLGTNIFFGCKSITEVILGEGMTAIPAGFLRGTKSLKSITVPSRIKEIRNTAFAESGLESIDLSQNMNMTKISKNAFEGCLSLSTAILPTSIEIIEEAAFMECNLKDGNMFDSLTNLHTIGSNAFTKCSFKDLSMPYNIENIGNLAFSQCYLLRTIKFHDYTYEVTQNKTLSIGDGAFTKCSDLEKIELPTGNEDNINFNIEIGKEAFREDVSLKEINIPTNVTLIDDYAFAECAAVKITSIYTKMTMYYIDKNKIHTSPGAGLSMRYFYSFCDEKYYDGQLGYFNMDDLKKASESESTDVPIYVSASAIEDSETVGLYSHGYTGLENIDLSKNNRTQFGKGVYFKCYNLNKVILPTQLKEIPESMFERCAMDLYTGTNGTVRSLKVGEDTWYHGLTTVEMPDTVEKIGTKAFMNCYSLNLNDDLSDNLVEIEASAFANCESIGKITFPSSLKIIRDSAFNGCGRIFDNYQVPSKGMTECDASKLANIEYIGKNAFTGCSFTAFIMNIEGKLKNIYAGTFADCQQLKNVRIANGVEKIHNTSFSRAVRMETIEIPDQCTIGRSFADGTLVVKKSYFQCYKDISDKCLVEVTDTSVKYVPLKFVVSIRVVEENQVVRVNNDFVMPFLAIPYNSSDATTLIETVKIGDNSLNYDIDTKTFIGPTANNPMNVNLIFGYKHEIAATELSKAESINAIAAQVTGIKAATDVPVIIEGIIEFKVGSASTENAYYGKTCAVRAQYSVDVQENPCTQIDTDDKVYINSTNKNTKYTIAPEFVPTYTDSDITDEIIWELETGSEYVSYTVSGDGKSIVINSLGVGYGTSKFKVTAGTVTKEIYVYNIIPATGVDMKKGDGTTIANKGSVDLTIGETLQVNSTLSYSQDVPVGYEDDVLYTSSDDNIVTINNVVEENGVTSCNLLAVGSGSATITVKSRVGNVSRTFTVVVSSDNLKAIVKDNDGVVQEDGKTITLLNKNGTTFNYELSEIVANNSVTAIVEDESVASVSVNTSRKTFTITGKIYGRTKVTIYPTAGTVENGGVTFDIVVDADVSKTVLAAKTIEVGKTESVFSSAMNVFKQKAESIDSVGSITTNTLTFSSSNESIATVDGYGNVTVVSLPTNGEKVTITCSAVRDGEVVKNSTSTVTITPSAPMVSNIVITGNTNIKKGEVTTINIGLEPVGCKHSGVSVSASSGYAKIVKYSFDSKTNTITVTGLTAGQVTFKVRVKKATNDYLEKEIEVNVSEESINDSTVNSMVSAPKKVKLTVKKGKKKATLKWSKLSSVSGYQIQMSKKKKKAFKTIKTIKKATKVKFVKKKLKSKKTYYFRVRAYVVNGSKKIYGKWSTVKKVKVK